QRLLFHINLALVVAIRLRQERRLRKRDLPAWNRMQASAHTHAIPNTFALAVAGPLGPAEPAGDAHPEPVAERDRRPQRRALVSPPPPSVSLRRFRGCSGLSLPRLRGRVRVGARRIRPMVKKSAA